MKKINFIRSKTNSCVYSRNSNNIIIEVYVDDLFILAPKGKTSIIEDIKSDLRKSFKIKKLDEIKRILNVQIIRIKFQRIVYFDQTAYIEKFFHEYAMKQNKVKSIAISMTNESFRKTTIDDESENSDEYVKRIGNMMFAMVYIRLDIGYALSKLNQFMNNSGKIHDVVVKQAFKYFRSTSQFRMKYGPIKIDDYEVTKIYCDFDYAKDLNNRRSVLNHVVMLEEEAVL